MILPGYIIFISKLPVHKSALLVSEMATIINGCPLDLLPIFYDLEFDTNCKIYPSGITSLFERNLEFKPFEPLNFLYPYEFPVNLPTMGDKVCYYSKETLKTVILIFLFKLAVDEDFDPNSCTI
jgi:hypothetical protein